MPFQFKPGRPDTPRQLTRVVRERTSISFSAADLAALARLIQAGQVLLPEEQRPAVVTRLKAAMTRMGVLIPPGL